MTNGPPTAPDAPPLWQMWRDLAEAQARTSQSVADQGARLAAVERSVPELAARLEGRVAALDAQMGRQADHLAQQDQAAERARLEQKSRDGLIQQRLDALTSAEQQRAQEARDAAHAAEDKRREAEDRARARHEQSASRVRQTVAGIAGFTASQVAAELAGLPLRWRLLALAAGALLALGWVLIDYLRTRPHGRAP